MSTIIISAYNSYRPNISDLQTGNELNMKADLICNNANNRMCPPIFDSKTRHSEDA